MTEWKAEISGPYSDFLTRWKITYYHTGVCIPEVFFRMTKWGAERSAKKALKNLRKDEQADKNVYRVE